MHPKGHAIPGRPRVKKHHIKTHAINVLHIEPDKTGESHFMKSSDHESPGKQGFRTGIIFTQTPQSTLVHCSICQRLPSQSGSNQAAFPQPR